MSKRYLKICYVGDASSVHVQKWLKYFSAKGHNVYLLSNRYSPFDNVNFYHIIRRKRIWKFGYFDWLLRIRKAINSIRPDILHCFFLYPYGEVCAFCGIHPLIITVLGSDIYVGPKNSLLRCNLAKFALRCADMVTADSEDLKHKAIRLGANRDRSYVIQLGIDMRKFNRNVDSEQVRKALNLHGAKVILSTRGFNSIYNTDIIIQAIPIVVKRFPNARFILLGRGNRTHIEDLIKRLNVGNYVKIIDYIDHEKIPQYYRVADIFISIPSYDGTPVSLLEAMGCGVSPIVSDIASVKEWISNGENGIVVPVRDYRRTADAIIDLLENDAKRRHFVETNLRIVSEKGNYLKWMHRVENLYYSLLTK